MNRTIAIVLVVLAVVILLPLLWMLGMMSMGGMMGGPMGGMMGGMGAWGNLWMILIAVLLVVLIGSPAKEIVRLADEMPADLVVMGTHGRGGFERLVLGSVTEKVLRTARAPVLTVSPGTEGAAGSPVRYKTVLCPLDFSAASTRALQYALSLAKQAGGRLILLHVVEGIADLPRETAHFNLPEYGAFLQQDAMSQLKAAIPDSG